jgi:ribosomal protein L24E
VTCKFCLATIQPGRGRLYIGRKRYRYVVRACPDCVLALMTWRMR